MPPEYLLMVMFSFLFMSRDCIQHVLGSLMCYNQRTNITYFIFLRFLKEELCNFTDEEIKVCPKAYLM